MSASLIAGGLGAGNGDFNYEGGGTVSGVGTATPNENIPRDRYLIGSPNVNATVDIDGWTIRRASYNGGNDAFGLDGNFGFDNEPANTGSGQYFQNGSGTGNVLLVADQIAFAGNAGEIIDLSYLLGSDSGGGTLSGTSVVTLTLDAGLGSEQETVFTLQSRSGTLRDGSNTILEQYVSTGAYTTVDLQFSSVNGAGSTRTLIDDVRLDVTPVPEPSSLALLGLGGLLIARRRRG